MTVNSSDRYSEVIDDKDSRLNEYPNWNTPFERMQDILINLVLCYVISVTKGTFVLTCLDIDWLDLGFNLPDLL